MLRRLMASEAVFRAEKLITIRKWANIWISVRMHFAMLLKVVLSNKTFAAAWIFANKSNAGMNVLMSLQMRPLTEAFEAIWPIALFKQNQEWRG